MKRFALSIVALGFAATAQAQVAPDPSLDDPRIQTLVTREGTPVRLVAFPDSDLELVFHRGEAIERVVVSDGNAFRAAVVGNGDTVQISPLRTGAVAELRVQTDRSEYRFNLETGNGLAAAYVVRLVDEAGVNEAAAASASQPAPGAAKWGYRLSGDRSVRPNTILDDGTRTFLQWDTNRALPAVFGVGPGGAEELVAGYMRRGEFVIDRVYPELVFRFDKEMAIARRDAKQEQ
jgi:type IV secretion system protein VirB9